ncbi:unnamed protein product [Pedinophyceae sp. YPF-701]|nr:unnamed protein product [Pedinophyceae sp. YPF-701]
MALRSRSCQLLRTCSEALAAGSGALAAPRGGTAAVGAVAHSRSWSGARTIFGSSSFGSDPSRQYQRPAPGHLGFVIVPEKHAYVVQRLGRHHKVLTPGLHFLIPMVDKVFAVHDMRELAIPIAQQAAITRDNVSISIDGVLYVRIDDPFKASYGVNNALFAVSQLAQTTMRSELGKMELDKTFEERELLNSRIVDSINEATAAWGLECLRYEIRDISPPPNVQAAMELQAEAERRRRAKVLESEGEKLSLINRAEGHKQDTILSSEAALQEAKNRAMGEAEYIRRCAEATAEAVTKVGAAMSGANGRHAASLRVAEQYVEAFGRLARETNTVVVPANAGDVGSMVAQAMGVFKGMQGGGVQGAGAGADVGPTEGRKGATDDRPILSRSKDE